MGDKKPDPILTAGMMLGATGRIDDEFLRRCRAVMTADELEEFWAKLGAFQTIEAAEEFWRELAGGRAIGKDLASVTRAFGEDLGKVKS